MALRSLLRKGPALAAALRSPAPIPRRSSPSLQALAPAAGARSMSQAPATAAGQTTLEALETLREEGDRAHAEFMQNMRIIQEQSKEFLRLEDEQQARFYRKLNTVLRACNIIIILSVASLALGVSRLM